MSDKKLDDAVVHRVNVTLTDKMYADLKKLAKNKGMPVPEFIRHLIAKEGD